MALSVSNQKDTRSISIGQPKAQPTTSTVQPKQTQKISTVQPKPQASLPVQTKPVPQPTIAVDNSPRFVRLGDAVKAKFPGIYDSIDSGQLGKTVAIKYPDLYNSLIDPATDPITEAPKPQGNTGIGGFLTGAVKGIGSTLNTISKAGQKALNFVDPFGDDEIAQIDKSRVTPNGLAEKLGFGAEQIAEFFIPSGAFAKVGKVADAGIEGLNLASKAETALKLGTKAGLGAIETAGVTAAQGGSKSDIKTAAGLGAFLSFASKGLELVLKNVPETAWSSILKRTPTEAAKNPKLPAQAAKTGLTGLTRQSIATKAQAAIQSIEVTLDDLLSKSKGTVNTAKVAGYLADLRNSYAAIPGEKSSVKAIDDIASELYESFKVGQSMTVLEANQLKRNIYQVISKSYGKGMLELPAKTEAQKLVAAGLKREIEKVIPEVKSLNQKQAVYLQIKNALDKTIARSEGKGIAGTGVGLYDLLLGGIGTGAGAIAGSPLLGLGLVAGKKTAESPLVLSSTAKLLEYFNTLSPTKKLLFYQAIKGLTVESGLGAKKSLE